MRHRIQSRPTLALPLMTTAGLALGALAPAAASAAGSVLQVNACDSGKAKCYTGKAPEKLPQLIRARGAQAVTLNEVCSTTTLQIARGLGYRSAFSQSGSQTCAGGRGAYGNAILVPPSRTSTGVRRWSYRDQQPGSEKRTLLCVVSTGRNICVTHLDSKGLAAKQGAELKSRLAGLERERPTVLGGDLNLKAVAPAQATVPAGMYRKGDGGVMHIIASKRLPFQAVRVMKLDWTDHPALQVSFR